MGLFAIGDMRVCIFLSLYVFTFDLKDRTSVITFILRLNGGGVGGL